MSKARNVRKARNVFGLKTRGGSKPHHKISSESKRKEICLNVAAVRVSHEHIGVKIYLFVAQVSANVITRAEWILLLP